MGGSERSEKKKSPRSIEFVNGISVISVNGISVNGISVNGISVNGISVSGKVVSGTEKLAKPERSFTFLLPPVQFSFPCPAFDRQKKCPPPSIPPPSIPSIPPKWRI